MTNCPQKYKKKGKYHNFSFRNYSVPLTFSRTSSIFVMVFLIILNSYLPHSNDFVLVLENSDRRVTISLRLSYNHHLWQIKIEHFIHFINLQTCRKNILVIIYLLCNILCIVMLVLNITEDFFYNVFQ